MGGSSHSESVKLVNTECTIAAKTRPAAENAPQEVCLRKLHFLVCVCVWL